jgi:hypothetical protein
VEAAAWETLGFEAFGPLARLERVLSRALDHLGVGAPACAGAPSSYPALLAGLRAR